jgi:magnesium-transporting ATPase (P-type)
LTVFEFSSARKRMSVVLKDINSDKVIIFCKGADSIIEKRLSGDVDRSILKKTFD